MQQPLFDPKYLNLEYLFYKIYQLFAVIKNFFLKIWAMINGSQVDFSSLISNLIKIIFTILIIALAVVIFYLILRILEIKKKHKEDMEKIVIPEPKTTINKRWEAVVEHANSNNDSDWRLAIIEADLILEDLLTATGYKGEGIGEKLKSVDEADFPTLQLAWEAHKVRNRIAHEGQTFLLSREESRRVINLYEKVFRDNKYI